MRQSINIWRSYALLYGDIPLFRNTIAPKHHCSEAPLLRNTIAPKHHYSETPLLRKYTLIRQLDVLTFDVDRFAGTVTFFSGSFFPGLISLLVLNDHHARVSLDVYSQNAIRIGKHVLLELSLCRCNFSVLASLACLFLISLNLPQNLKSRVSLSYIYLHLIGYVDRIIICVNMLLLYYVPNMYKKIYFVVLFDM